MAALHEELTARIDHTLTRDQAATILADPLATLRPSHNKLDTQEEHALETLLELFEAQQSGGAYQDFEDHLGTGAMGVVRTATQPGINRKVAVKTLKLAYRDRGSTLRLLQEAWVTGSLEHPNVVPVYEIALDRDKSPQVVLKRIEGLHWRDLLRSPDKLREHLGEEDLLEWNLRTLMQVASAVHFAHSQGIVHRDVKPENVMVGPFGDVYLMDWGIAVSVRPEDEGRLPLAWQVTEMAGTPGYMAPEMLDGDPPHVGPRTDVYLLGATLYEIVTGRAPHRGSSLMELVKSIVRSDPYFPPDAPAPLVAICQTAMASDPADRFESAEAFRQALQDFLRHRGSARLCYEASLKLSSFEAHLLEFQADLPEALAAELDARVSESPTIDARLVELDDDTRTSGKRRDRAKLYDLFGACRFGFQQALEEGDNEVAREGLERVISLMAQFELSQDNLSAAELLVLELKKPPKALRRLLAQHQRAEEQRLVAIEKLQREHDRNVGRRTRAGFIAVLGVLWTFSPFFAERVNATGRGFLLTSSLWTAFFLVLGAGLAIYTRKAMTASALNRGLVGTIMVTLSAQLAINLGVYLSGGDVLVAQVDRLFLWGVATSVGTVVLDRRLWPAAVLYLIGYLGASAYPQAVFRWMSVCNLGLAVNGFVIWWPRKSPIRPLLRGDTQPTGPLGRG